MSDEARSFEAPQDSWYCEHGYYQGHDCPDCDVPSYLPSALEQLYRTGREVFILHQTNDLTTGGPYAEELARRARAFNDALEHARAELRLCDPDRGIHFHGGGDTCECGQLPNTSYR